MADDRGIETPVWLDPEISGLHPDREMTEKQAIKLRALCEETGEPFDGSLNQPQAQKRIAALEEVAAS